MEDPKRLLFKEKCYFILVANKVEWCGQPQTQAKKKM